MSQRFTPDRSTFEQFLAVASLLQEFRQRSYKEPAAVMPQTSVPGIGLRAALWDDEEPKQPSKLLANIKAGYSRGAGFATTTASNATHAVGRSISQVVGAIVHVPRVAASRIETAVQKRPKLPPFPTQAIHTRVESVGSSCRNALMRARSRVRTSVKSIGVPPTPKAVLKPVEHQTITPAKEASDNILRRFGRALRDAPNVIPDLPPFPAHEVGQGLRCAARGAGKIAAWSGDQILAGLSQLRVPRDAEWGIDGRTLRKSAPAFVILSVMLAFIFSQPGIHKTVQVASASTAAPVAAPTAAAILPAPHLPQRTSIKASPQAATHKTITDPAIRADLENMTRYEVKTLRRAAESGDDIAAFQLGMAYEMGYELPQNCAKAAEWVTKAAEAGNPAAEYNLGLRYRDGDGVARDPQQAAGWLQKAADQKYANARAILASSDHSSK